MMLSLVFYWLGCVYLSVCLYDWQLFLCSWRSCIRRGLTCVYRTLWAAPCCTMLWKWEARRSSDTSLIMVKWSRNTSVNRWHRPNGFICAVFMPVCLTINFKAAEQILRLQSFRSADLYLIIRNTLWCVQTSDWCCLLSLAVLCVICSVCGGCCVKQVTFLSHASFLQLFIKQHTITSGHML